MTKEDYEKRFGENYRIEGFGLDVTIHSPCPFCAAPDFMDYKILDVRQALQEEHVCAECGRGMKGTVADAVHDEVTVQVHQTQGEDPPPFIPIPRA